MQFFELIKNIYGIEKPDMLQYALELTDENYCKRISDKVFEQISEVLVYNGMDYIVTDSAHINDIGLDEFEGIIQVSLKRKADYYVDFENEDSFDEPEVVDGHLEESYYRPWH